LICALFGPYAAMFLNRIYPGKSLKMSFVSPGKPWNLVFASPGKSWKTVFYCLYEPWTLYFCHYKCHLGDSFSSLLQKVVIFCSRLFHSPLREAAMQPVQNSFRQSCYIMWYVILFAGWSWLQFYKSSYGRQCPGGRNGQSNSGYHSTGSYNGSNNFSTNQGSRFSSLPLVRVRRDSSYTLHGYSLTNSESRRKGCSLPRLPSCLVDYERTWPVGDNPQLVSL